MEKATLNIKFILIAVPLLFLACWPAEAKGVRKSASCDGLDHPQEIACIAKDISEKKARLDSLYHAALSKLSDHDPNDNRRSRSQLEKSETAWSQYVEENCAYVGGQEGGSNSWVTYFSELCLVDEYDARITFFRDPPSSED